MKFKLFLALSFLFFVVCAAFLGKAWAAMSTSAPSVSGTVAGVTVNGQPILQPPAQNVSEFKKSLQEEAVGSVWTNPVKFAIRNAVSSGVSVETIVLLLLLPVVAAFIAACRHLVGLRGFGIFLPASLGVVFLATGPVVGVGLFLIIIAISTLFRVGLRGLRLKLQYLPRMSLMLWAVSLGVLGLLFAAPYLSQFSIRDVSIFPVLILVLLAEEFTRVHLGKSIDVAVSLTSETLILAVLTFTILSYKDLQVTSLLHPELVLLIAALFNIFLGRYTGLRLLEIWRFRHLLRK